MTPYLHAKNQNNSKRGSEEKLWTNCQTEAIYLGPLLRRSKISQDTNTQTIRKIIIKQLLRKPAK